MIKNITYCYCRVSTDKQDTSLLVQEEKIRQYCILNNLDISKIIIENNVSGKIPIFERPQGNMLLTEKYDHLVILKLDRAFRSTIDCLNTVQFLNKKDISLHIVDMNGTAVNTRSAIGELFLTMTAAFAQMERKMIGERTSSGLQKRRANGMTFTRISPFGYKNTSKGNPMIPIENEIAIMQLAKKLRAEGLSYRKISDSLSLNPRNGKRFMPQAIKNMINR